MKEEDQMYMNVHSGEVSAYGGWDYTSENGKSVNAVDLGSVIPVRWNHEVECWEEDLDD